VHSWTQCHVPRWSFSRNYVPQNKALNADTQSSLAQAKWGAEGRTYTSAPPHTHYNGTALSTTTTATTTTSSSSNTINTTSHAFQ